MVSIRAGGCLPLEGIGLSAAALSQKRGAAARLSSRVKGDEQNNGVQTKTLKAAGCRRLFEEAASGGRWDRPELRRLLDQLREGDTVVVWKLDRLSRSLKDVLRIMEKIAKTGAGFRSITENIDTTAPAGRMMMQMVGAFAEFERTMIRERTSAGLAAARAEGRVGGRRKKLERRPNPTLQILQAMSRRRSPGMPRRPCKICNRRPCKICKMGPGRRLQSLHLDLANHDNPTLQSLQGISLKKNPSKFPGKRKEIADSVISGREMARLYNISAPNRVTDCRPASDQSGLACSFEQSSGDPFRTGVSRRRANQSDEGETSTRPRPAKAAHVLR